MYKKFGKEISRGSCQSFRFKALDCCYLTIAMSSQNNNRGKPTWKTKWQLNPEINRAWVLKIWVMK